MRNLIENFVSKIQKTCDTRNERGNVLFLILIAVALFAALSYAVTSSSRSGGGDASDETNLVSSASLTQYPSTIRTSLIRMLIGGYSVDEILFDDPSDFSNLNNDSLKGKAIFHPVGGGATFVEAPSDVIASGSKQAWLFNSRYQILNIGTDDANNGSNEIIAFLPGMKKGVCERINRELNIGLINDADGNGIPNSGIVIANVPTVDMNQDSGNTGIGAYDAAFVIGKGDNGKDFAGEPFGCADFDDATNGTADGDFVYYHVLTER